VECDTGCGCAGEVLHAEIREFLDSANSPLEEPEQLVTKLELIEKLANSITKREMPSAESFSDACEICDTCEVVFACVAARRGGR